MRERIEAIGTRLQIELALFGEHGHDALAIPGRRAEASPDHGRAERHVAQRGECGFEIGPKPLEAMCLGS